MEGLALSAPSPNPARGAASLVLSLGSRAQVDVSIFDAAGRASVNGTLLTVTGGGATNIVSVVMETGYVSAQ